MNLNDCNNLDKFFNMLKNQANDKEEYVYIGRHLVRYKSTWKILKEFDFTSVLDIGCGRGHFGLLLKSFGKNYIGIDMPKPVNICIERGLDAYNVNIEKEILPFDDNRFDIVLCLEVIEHMNNTDTIFLEVNRVLKNNGIFVASTPNGYMPSWIIRELIFRNSKVKELITGSDRIGEDYKHDKLFNKKELTEIFKKFGFEILTSRHIRIVFPFDDIIIVGRKTNI